MEIGARPGDVPPWLDRREPRLLERVEGNCAEERFPGVGRGGIEGKEIERSEVGVESSMAVVPAADSCCCWFSRSCWSWDCWVRIIWRRRFFEESH